MSFSLEVFAVTVPDDVTRSWIAGLMDHGLVVETHPKFDFLRWQGGWVSFKCSTQVSGYPRRGFPAGFELDVDSTVDAIDVPEDASDGLRELLGQANALFHLSTPSSRTVGDLRLQSFGAAVLAEVCGGAVYDPQRDEFFRGADALVNARREAESFESSAEAEAWGFDTFRGWSGAR